MKKAIVDTYIDTTLMYLDTCTAVDLCGPVGPCKYKVKGKHQIDNKILSQNIAVTRNTLFCSQVAANLALSLIWSLFEEAE